MLLLRVAYVNCINVGGFETWPFLATRCVYLDTAPEFPLRSCHSAAREEEGTLLFDAAIRVFIFSVAHRYVHRMTSVPMCTQVRFCRNCHCQCILWPVQSA